MHEEHECESHRSHMDNDGNGPDLGYEHENIRYGHPRNPRARQPRDPHGFEEWIVEVLERSLDYMI